MKLLIIGVVVGIVLALGCFFGGMQVERLINDNSTELKMLNELHNEHEQIAMKLAAFEQKTDSKLDEIGSDVKAILRIASRPLTPDVEVVSNP